MRLKQLNFAVIILITAISVGCDGYTRLQGRISDSAGKPISNVRVTLTAGKWNRTVNSDENGLYKVGMTHAPFKVALSLTAEKDGYQKYEKRFYSTDHLRSLDITLPVETSVPTPHHSLTN